jgi:hypothetical protein
MGALPMLFMVWSDTGDCIKAYMVPDNFSSQSSLSFFSGGDLLKTLPPNAFNEHIGARHETGQVGFIVDETMVEGLSKIEELEIRDSETDILVYRRTAEPKRQAQIFRLETHVFPLWRFDQALKPHFKFWYDRIDRHTAETARNILSFHAFGSLYSSGRLLYGNYDYYIYKHQKTAIIFHDPYEELAERLLIFNRLGMDANRLLNDRDAMIFAPILDIARSLKTFDERELRRVLGAVEPRTLALIGDPLTRQLVCQSPDEPAPRGAVNKTLKTLSEFDIVGTRRGERLFRAGMAELLGEPEIEIPPIPEIPKVRDLARRLRAVRWIEGLIENDLEVYQNVTEAFAATT